MSVPPNEEAKNKRTPLETIVPLSTPYVVFIDPSGACNFTCSFCPCNVSSFLREERHRKMSISMFEKIVNDLSEFEEKIKVINLYGFGEPLLNDDLAEMIQILKIKNVCNEIRITTNGALLNPELNSLMIQNGADLIRISIEGLNGSSYKEICDYELDFELFLENIRDLYAKSRNKAKISVKAMNQILKNKDEIGLFYKLFSPISDYAYIENIDDHWAEFDEMKHFDTTEYVRKKCFTDIEKPLACSFPFTDMVIHANGSVVACCTDWKFGTKYGDVKNDNLKELWHSQKLYDFRMLQLTQERSHIHFCKSCKYKPSDDISGVTDEIVDRMNASRENRKDKR